MGYSLLADLIIEIEDAMKETTLVLSGFHLFKPECFNKSEHVKKVKNDSFKGQTICAAPVINPIYEYFMEAFNDR